MSDARDEPGTASEPGMVKEEITKPDGRYLIYYTFEDGDDPSAARPRLDHERGPTTTGSLPAP